MRREERLEAALKPFSELVEAPEYHTDKTVLVEVAVVDVIEAKRAIALKRDGLCGRPEPVETIHLQPRKGKLPVPYVGGKRVGWDEVSVFVWDQTGELIDEVSFAFEDEAETRLMTGDALYGLSEDMTVQEYSAIYGQIMSAINDEETWGDLFGYRWELHPNGWVDGSKIIRELKKWKGGGWVECSEEHLRDAGFVKLGGREDTGTWWRFADSNTNLCFWHKNKAATLWGSLLDYHKTFCQVGSSDFPAKNNPIG